MSGIFKGDSIYKSGGGGGGFKNGGELADGDFIKVENNTISSYDNVIRDPVNFYFEVKDGEFLNSVVELTTAVNATINVYVVRNGLYYHLGNVGGNTVNAGDDYKVNITGDSYEVEQITTTSDLPQYLTLKDGRITPLHYLGVFDGKKRFATGNLGNYLTYDQQNYIVSNNPNLGFLSLDLMNWVNDNIPNPKAAFNITEYPGYKYRNDGPYDVGVEFIGKRNHTYGWKFTNNENNKIQDGSGMACSCLLIYSMS